MNTFCQTAAIPTTSKTISHTPWAYGCDVFAVRKTLSEWDYSNWEICFWRDITDQEWLMLLFKDWVTSQESKPWKKWRGNLQKNWQWWSHTIQDCQGCHLSCKSISKPWQPTHTCGMSLSKACKLHIRDTEIYVNFYAEQSCMKKQTEETQQEQYRMDGRNATDAQPACILKT